MKSLTIGKVAQLAEIGIEAIRFYEREGLISEPPRRESGYRQYPEDTVARLRFIKRAKELGFSLREIKELLSLRIDPETTCDDIRERAEAKISDIDGKIRTLQRIKKVLAKLAAACPGQGPVSECPILESLDDSPRGLDQQETSSSKVSLARKRSSPQRKM